MKNLKKLKLIYNTAKNMTTKQVMYRLKYQFQKKIKKNIKVKVYRKDINNNFKYYSYINYDLFKDYDFNGYKEEADNILKNKFKFLNNLTYNFKEEIIWNKNPFDYRLWNFNLNYFDYLINLNDISIISENKKYVYKGFKLINEWIDSNSVKYDANIWDPYVISKRLINWIIFYSFNKELCHLKNKLINSIYTQSEFLYRNIEYYLSANHVIMDGKALVFSGIFFENKKYLKKGLEILHKEYAEQVLNDGGHYERSTSYQVEVLMHYFEVAILLLKNNYENLANKWFKKIEPMFQYLNSIVMPNGEIPLLNDSTLDYPILANDLLECATIMYNNPEYKQYGNNKLSLYGVRLAEEGWYKVYNKLKTKNNSINKNIEFSSTGYYIIKDYYNGKEVYLLFDCGDNGPDYNLGHTHADSLNVIFTIGTKKIFTDSGTYTYKICSKRNYYRSTEAHNTINIDKISSSQVWKAFRVAKRAKTQLLKYKDTDNYTLICAKHNGYTKLLKGKDKIIHKRTILYLKGKGFIIIDMLYGNIEKNHIARLLYHTECLNINKINNKKIQIDNVYVCFNETYNSKNTKLSKVFNEEFYGNKIVIEKEFNRNIIMLTKVEFKENIIEIKYSNNSLKVTAEELDIHLNLENMEIITEEH